MTEKAPEIHVKALLQSLDTIGASADAIRQRAQQLAAPPSAAPAGSAKATPAPSSK